MFPSTRSPLGHAPARFPIERAGGLFPWALLLLALGWLGCFPPPASGSHFRYANLSWSPTGVAGEVQFRLQLAIRRDLLGLNGVFPGGIDNHAETGDVVALDVQEFSFDYGDGSGLNPVTMVVTAFSVAENWILGEVLDPQTGSPGPRHRYPGPGPFIAGISRCCRLGPNSLNNRAGASYVIRTTVQPLSGNHSPVGTLVPVLYLPESPTNALALPAMDPDGDQLRYELATEAEAGACCNPPGLTIDPRSGLLSWNTLGLDTNRFWTAQVKVKDLTPEGQVKTSATVDFLLKVISSGNRAPSCSLTPAGPLTVTAGKPLAVTLRGTDPDEGDLLMLNVTGLPRGARMVPSPPVTGTNLVKSRLDWTPGWDQVGSHTVLFSLVDAGARQSLCVLPITVLPSGEAADVQLTLLAPEPYIGLGARARFLIGVTNLGPAVAVGVGVSDRLPAGLTDIILATSSGHCLLTGGVLRCTLESLAVGEGLTLDITGTVEAPGSLLNVAEVSSVSRDPDLQNNAALATILVRNLPPLVSLVSPVAGTTLTLPPGWMQLEAEASDADSGVAQVEFLANGQSVGRETNAPFVLPWVAPAVGNYQLQAVALDWHGAATTSAPVAITVRACDPGLSIAPLASLERCLCEEAIFSTRVVSGEPATCLWRANGIVLPGETNPVLVLRGLRPADAGVYEVEVHTPCASARQSAVLTLKGAGNQNPAFFTNGARITIYDNAVAVPYPSSLRVDCVPAVVRHLTVTLHGFTHNYPDDVDVLLVGPEGSAVRLLSDAGGFNRVTNLVLRFSDTATALLPDSGALLSGTYAPTDYGVPLDTFPLPAPGGVMATNFAPFVGGPANGLWSLFVRDDLGGDAGYVAGGWSLGVEWADEPPRLAGGRLTADGAFEVTLFGLPRMTHVLEVSRDLVSWIPLSTNLVDGALPLRWPASAGMSGPSFFRAVRCP